MGGNGDGILDVDGWWGGGLGDDVLVLYGLD